MVSVPRHLGFALIASGKVGTQPGPSCFELRHGCRARRDCGRSEGHGRDGCNDYERKERVINDAFCFSGAGQDEAELPDLHHRKSGEDGGARQVTDDTHYACDHSELEKHREHDDDGHESPVVHQERRVGQHAQGGEEHRREDVP